MLDQLVFILQGFGLVMAVLALLWFISALLGRLFGVATKPTLKPPVPAAPAPAVDEGVPAAHLAAIAAAVAVLTGDRGRVVRVRIPAHGIAGWVGSAHTHHAVGRRLATGWRSPAPARNSTATGTSEDAS